MKDLNCRLCNPVNINWKEKGFYGYQCSECSSGKTAFIILEEHKGILSKEEEVIYKELIKKYYPDLVPKGLAKNRTTCLHWYEFLVMPK